MASMLREVTREVQGTVSLHYLNQSSYTGVSLCFYLSQLCHFDIAPRILVSGCIFQILSVTKKKL